MKILMYAPIFPPAIGGPSTQCFSLCQALTNRGEKVVVVTVGEHFEKKSPDGYPVYRYPWQFTHTPLDKAIRWIVFPFYFSYILFKEKPDVVHSHSASALSFIVGALCSLYGIPTVIKFAGDWVWETLSTSGVKAKDFDDLRRKSALARFMWRVEKVGLSFYDFIWCPSEFRAQNIDQVQGHRRNVRIIYNSLDLPEGSVHEVKEGDPYVVISANRYIPHKRLPWLVKVFAELKDSQALLVLIGFGPEEEMQKVRDAAKEHKVESQVTITGRIESSEIYERFAKASVYVSTSLEEGFPNVFVEAMHFGLPIISTDVGGCKEIVREGETGYLYEPEDEVLFLRRLEELKTNIPLRNKMAKVAYDLSTQYDLKVVVEQFLDLYKTAISSHR